MTQSIMLILSIDFDMVKEKEIKYMDYDYDHQPPQTDRGKYASKPHTANRYHFDEIPIGASRFYVTLNTHAVSASASAYGKRYGYVMATRKERNDKEQDGIRVWKIEKVVYRDELIIKPGRASAAKALEKFS